MVKVKDQSDRMANRVGIVQKIRIVSHTSHVLVFVEIYDAESGASPVMMFDPEQLQRHVYADTTAKRVERCPMRNEFILVDLQGSHIVRRTPLKAAA